MDLQQLIERERMALKAQIDQSIQQLLQVEQRLEQKFKDIEVLQVRNISEMEQRLNACIDGLVGQIVTSLDQRISFLEQNQTRLTPRMDGLDQRLIQMEKK